MSHHGNMHCNGDASVRAIDNGLDDAEGRNARIEQEAAATAQTPATLGASVRRSGRRAMRAARAGAARVRSVFAVGADETVAGIKDAAEAAGDEFENALYADATAWTTATDAAREVSRDALASVRDTAASAREEIRGYVRAKPLSALGIAGLAGLVIGLCVMRRR